MTIATYADLKSAVASWLNRSNLTSQIPDFITMGCNRIYFGSQEPPFQTEPLRVRQMETSTTVSISAASVALPTRFLRVRAFSLTDGLGGPALLPATPEYVRSNFTTQNSTGRPKYYSVEGENFTFGPAPDTTYSASLLYYEQPAAFSADGDTNSLLTANPMLYLSASLVEAFAFVRNTVEAEKWHAKFVGSANAMQVSDDQDRYTGRWVARPDMSTP